MPGAYILTLGCPKNEADSERFAGCFHAAGWSLVQDAEKADLLLLNTCAFISPAIEESVEAIADVIQWKASAQGRKLVLAGCLPGRFGDDGSGGLEDFELVIGPGDTGALLEWLGHASARVLPFSSGGSSRFLRIADGCSNRCAYCTIPLIRGSFKPVDHATILSDAERLAASGAREIGLVAQDSARWEWKGRGLVDLVDELSMLHPNVWWRLYYLHPARFPFQVIDLMCARKNVMPYVDLPIQHVSNSVLKRMGRGYRTDDLNHILEAVDSASERIAARITVITGYPGETAEDFSELLEFLTRWDCIRNLVAFPYYPEEGTLEYKRVQESMDQISSDVVDERLMLIGSVSESILNDWGAWMENRIIEAIADSSEFGHTIWDAPDIDCRCVFSGKVVSGKVVRGKVTECRGSDVLLEPEPFIQGFSEVRSRE